MKPEIAVCNKYSFESLHIKEIVFSKGFSSNTTIKDMVTVSFTLGQLSYVLLINYKYPFYMTQGVAGFVSCSEQCMLFVLNML